MARITKSEHHNKRDGQHNENEHGMGARPSPPDPEDFSIEETLERVPVLAANAKAVRATAPPPFYTVPDRPPITDQDGTSMCIAYSAASDQNAEDRSDFGTFFNFDEPLFFQQIGGGPNGAFMRAALDRRLKHGIPVTGVGKAAKHRITAYHRVNLNQNGMKDAIRIAGGVMIVIPWFHSWFHLPKSAKLPEPDYEVGIHAFWIAGWRDDLGGFKSNQSWGTDYGKRGKFFLPYGFLSLGIEAWQTTDR